jgi:hypothetical protein
MFSAYSEGDQISGIARRIHGQTVAFLSRIVMDSPVPSYRRYIVELNMMQNGRLDCMMVTFKNEIHFLLIIALIHVSNM